MKQIIQDSFDDRLQNVLVERQTCSVDCRELRILIQEGYLPSRSSEETIVPQLNEVKVSGRSDKQEIFNLVVYYLRNTCYIHKIWIHPRYRGNNISESIVHNVSELMQSRGFSNIVSVPLTRAGKELLKSCNFNRSVRRNGKDILEYDN